MHQLLISQLSKYGVGCAPDPFFPFGENWNSGVNVTVGAYIDGLIVVEESFKFSEDTCASSPESWRTKVLDRV